MIYDGSWDINCNCNRQIFFVILGHFFAFLPPNSPKNQNFQKWEKHLEISSFYTSVPKNMIIGYTVPEICHVTDIIVIFHFGLFLALFYPANTLKYENLKKWKNYLKISSFYTSVLKDMIICYTVPEIWHVTSVIVIWAFFCPFTPLRPPKMKISKKWKITSRFHHFTVCTKNHDYMPSSWDMACDWYNCCCLFWAIFCPFYLPLTVQNMKISKNEKNTRRYHHLH